MLDTLFKQPFKNSIYWQNNGLDSQNLCHIYNNVFKPFHLLDLCYCQISRKWPWNLIECTLSKYSNIFDVQRSGQLPKWQRITFRADSGLNDGRQDNASHWQLNLFFAFTEWSSSTWTWNCALDWKQLGNYASKFLTFICAGGENVCARIFPCLSKCERDDCRLISREVTTTLVTMWNSDCHWRSP